MPFGQTAIPQYGRSVFLPTYGMGRKLICASNRSWKFELEPLERQGWTKRTCAHHVQRADQSTQEHEDLKTSATNLTFAEGHSQGSRAIETKAIRGLVNQQAMSL
jgi:hypothetical protein